MFARKLANIKEFKEKLCISIQVSKVPQSIHILSKHSLCSLVRKYYFLTSDSIAIFGNYFQFFNKNVPITLIWRSLPCPLIQVEEIFMGQEEK
jgi:hypothetical protein